MNNKLYTSRYFKTAVNNMLFLRHSSSKVKNNILYCVENVRKYDYENYLCTLLLPKEARAAAFVIRAFNIEVAQVQDIVSDQNIGQMRLLFWKEAIEEMYKGSYKASPILEMLSKVVKKHNLTKRWLLNLVESRELSLQNRPFSNMQEVGAYAEKTNTAINYLILETLGVKDVHADHAVSHSGKSQGIVTLIRSIPYNAQRRRVLLPQDAMIQHSVSQQDVIRGCREQKMKDLVYFLASEANSNLEAAHILKKNLPKEAFPAMLPSVCSKYYLKAIQKADFDVFDSRLQQRNNWLPLLLWIHQKRKDF